MGMLMYGLKDERKQAKQKDQSEQQAPTRNALQNDPTAARRSAIRRQPAIRRQDNPVAERHNGRSSPRSVRLALSNYVVDDRDGEVVFSRRPVPPRPHFLSLFLDSNRTPGRESRRTRRAEVEERQSRQNANPLPYDADDLIDLPSEPRAQFFLYTLGRNGGDVYDPNDRQHEMNRLHFWTLQGCRGASRTVGSTFFASPDDQRRSLNEAQRTLSNLCREQRSAAELHHLWSVHHWMSAFEEIRPDHEASGSGNRPMVPPRERSRSPRRQPQVPSYDDLTIDARRELDQIMGSLRSVDGLGDRLRSPSPENGDDEPEENAWETLLTTITPDERLPSLESSFNTAAAEEVSNSLGALPDTQRGVSPPPQTGVLPDTQRSISPRTGVETTATTPSLANLPSAIPQIERLQSPNCDEDETGMATPNSLPELVRVQRVRSPADSVRPDHVQPEEELLERFRARFGRRSDSRGNNAADDATDSAPLSQEIDQSQGRTGRSFDEARRDLERDIEEYSRSRMQRLLASFMERGDSEGIPDELWQAFVPRNVLAGAAGVESERR